MKTKIKKSEEEWKKILAPEQCRVLREKGTELPFTGKYDRHFENGKYEILFIITYPYLFS